MSHAMSAVSVSRVRREWRLNALPEHVSFTRGITIFKRFFTRRAISNGSSFSLTPFQISSGFTPSTVCMSK